MNAQGTIEWYIDRLGKITGSEFCRVLGTLPTRQRYYDELLEQREVLAQGREAAAEYVRATAVTAKSLEWGNRMEPRARAAYELLTDTEVEQVGFITLYQHEQIGVSLDGRVYQGTIEIKSPIKMERHISNVRHGMAAEHIPQVQGGLWVTGALFCDFVSYHAAYEARPCFIQRIPRDDAYISMLAERVLAFADALDKRAPLVNDVPEDTRAVPDLF